MILWLWITLMSAVWLMADAANEVATDCKPPPEELGKTTQFVKDLGTAAELAGNTLIKLGEVAKMYQPLVDLISPAAGGIAGLVGNMVPGCDPTTQVLDAIRELKAVMVERFDRLEKQLEQAVNLIDARIHKNLWGTEVIVPMEQLRSKIGALINGNFSSDLVKPVVILCKDPHNSPFGILSYIWSTTTKACKGPGNSTTLQGNHCDIDDPHFVKPCKLMVDSCIARSFIEEANFDNRVADYMYDMVINSIIELTAFQAVCSNLTWDSPVTIKSENDQFMNKSLTILNEMPPILEEVVERYWKESAESYAKTFMNGADPKENAEKAWKALDEAYTWYKHTAVLFSSHNFLYPDYKFGMAGLYERGGMIELAQTCSPAPEIPAILLISRYRNASKFDDADVRGHYKNYQDWLNQTIPSGQGCANDNVAGCLHNFAADTTTKPKERVDWLWDVLTKHAGGVMTAGRNRGYIHLAAPAGVYVSHWGHCDDTACANVLNDRNGVVHVM